MHEDFVKQANKRAADDAKHESMLQAAQRAWNPDLVQMSNQAESQNEEEPAEARSSFTMPNVKKVKRKRADYPGSVVVNQVYMRDVLVNVDKNQMESSKPTR